MDFTYEDVAGMIDHSLLKPTLTQDELDDGCRRAADLRVASVCIMPFSLRRCAELLDGSGVMPSTTIGFPHGGHTTATKARESEIAVADGCQELDMVVNISQVLSGNWDAVTSDIRAVIDVAHASDRRVKVIFENCFLNNDQKIRLCDICGELKADWVKTSTGYGTGGATVDDVRLMRKHSPDHVQVKAAGGVRTLDALLEMRALGVTRCGASATESMMAEAKQRLGSA